MNCLCSYPFLSSSFQISTVLSFLLYVLIRATVNPCGRPLNLRSCLFNEVDTLRDFLPISSGISLSFNYQWVVPDGSDFVEIVIRTTTPFLGIWKTFP
jgi:hypothetical protein